MDNKQTFDHLRNLAKLKCDQDIEFARTTYKERLAQIDQMEVELGTIIPTVVRQIKTRRKKGETKAIVVGCMPTDAAFTIDDLMAELKKTVGNVPNIGSVRNLVRTMKRNGELKEVVNKKSRLLKLYAFPDVDAGDTVEPLTQIVTEVLSQANAPMRPVEICVWLIERDRAIDGDPSAVVGQVLRTLRSNPDRFKEADTGHWKIV